VKRTPPERRCLYVWGGDAGGWYGVFPPSTTPDGGALDDRSQLAWLFDRRAAYESEGYSVKDGDSLIGPPEGPPDAK